MEKPKQYSFDNDLWSVLPEAVLRTEVCGHAPASARGDSMPTFAEARSSGVAMSLVAVVRCLAVLVFS